MRKQLFSALIVVFLLIAASEVSAQSRAANGTTYRNAIGLGIDFGTGSTLVGPSFKHFFSENSVGKFEVLFGNYVALQGFYEYHSMIDGAPGLQWFAGIGAGVGLDENNSAFLLKPIGGLDYKFDDVPLSLSFDWRPTAFIGDDSDFEAGRFGLGFRFCFN